MRSACTPQLWKVERTCRIGVGIKAASHGKILGEHQLAAAKPLQRREADPLFPFVGQIVKFHNSFILSAGQQPHTSRLLVLGENLNCIKLKPPGFEKNIVQAAGYGKMGTEHQSPNPSVNGNDHRRAPQFGHFWRCATKYSIVHGIQWTAIVNVTHATAAMSQAHQ